MKPKSKNGEDSRMNFGYIEKQEFVEFKKIKHRLIQSYPQGVYKVGPHNIPKFTGKGCVVGIIDSGLGDTLHKDLQANFIKEVDYVKDSDYDDHCNHVAGVICANGNILGVAKNAKFISYRVYSDSAKNVRDKMIVGLCEAVKDGCNIINISMGGKHSQKMEFIVKYAELHNVLIVAAAGNDYSKELTYPGCFSTKYENVIGVGAVEYNLNSGFVERALFSNCNKGVTCCSEGVDVLSTATKNRYKTMSGTSMATPHVVGAAAVMWEELKYKNKGKVSVKELKSKLLERTKDVFKAGDSRFRKKRDECSGYGFVTFFPKLKNIASQKNILH